MVSHAHTRSEAKAHLSQYARQCHEEPIIVTINGVPAFQLAPLEQDDDRIEQLLEYNPSFRRLLEKRLREPVVAMRDARKALR